MQENFNNTVKQKFPDRVHKEPIGDFLLDVSGMNLSENTFLNGSPHQVTPSHKFSLANKTGAFDTFGEVLLEEGIEQEDRHDRYQTAGFLPYDLLSWADLDCSVVEECDLELRVEVLEHKRYGIILSEECGAYVVVVPVPYHREEEYCKER